MITKNFISVVNYSNDQKIYEDTKGYIHNYKQYLPKSCYVNKFYNITFSNEFQQQKKIFNNCKLDLNSLKNIFENKESSYTKNIIYELEKNNRFISNKYKPSLLLQHLISVGYSYASLNISVNYNNLVQGKPIVFFIRNKHYLLLPEDFGYETIFLSNQQSNIKEKEYISKYF